MQNIRPNDANHAEPSGMDKEVKGFDICSALNINNVPNLEEYFCADGVFTVKVLAMGGSTVLLTFESKKLMEHFLSVDPSWLQQLFIDIHPWQFQGTLGKTNIAHMSEDTYEPASNLELVIINNQNPPCYSEQLNIEELESSSATNPPAAPSQGSFEPIGSTENELESNP
ncbi:hypothetical protein GH714_022727 [Hevea brasiliensis]|uniref:DUF4283 domain-containing protein n=1 Tax=Hevea brasiliensis TaxID=3981 RepID=A0A6A6N1U1_HEVBR|nr:hypothetical protein GH714_022727 [Hevea brasiliensis]